MNRAAKALVARGSLICANAVRLLLMAGIKASTFLAGFRQRQDGETMPLWKTNPTPLVARLATMHNGVRIFCSDAAPGKIKLRYQTHHYDYDEDTIYLRADGFSIVTELSVSNQRFPDTVLTAFPGRRLRDVIGYHGNSAFFASKFTTIAHAEMSDFPGSDAVDLILNIKWHHLSQVPPHLR